MAVGDVSTLRIVGRYQDQNIVNTMHYKHTAQDTDDEGVLAVLLAAWEADWEAVWLARHSEDYELIGLKAFRQAGEPKTPAFLTIGEAGGVVGTELPALVCRTITMYTASAKHRRRGRLMLSGSVAESFNATDGALTATELAALVTMAGLCSTVLTNLDDSFAPCIPANATDDEELIIDALPRVTPSAVTSRRIKQYLIG